MISISLPGTKWSVSDASNVCFDASPSRSCTDAAGIRLSSLDTDAESTWNSPEISVPSISTLIEHTSGVAGVGITEVSVIGAAA